MKKFFTLIAFIFIVAINANAQMCNRPAIDAIIFKANGVKLYCIKEGHSMGWYKENCVAMGGHFSSDKFASEEYADRFANYLWKNKQSLEIKYNVIIDAIKSIGKFVTADIYNKDTYLLEQKKRQENFLHFGNMTVHIYDGKHIEKIEYTVGDYTFSGKCYSQPTYASLIKDRKAIGGYIMCYASNEYEASVLANFIEMNKEELEKRDNVVIFDVKKERCLVSMLIYEKKTYELEAQRHEEERNEMHNRLASLDYIFAE